MFEVLRWLSYYLYVKDPLIIPLIVFLSCCGNARDNKEFKTSSWILNRDPLSRIWYYLILILSFFLGVVVFSFLGTVYPLQIRRKKAKICLNVKSMTANSSELAAICNFQKRGLGKNLSPMQRQKGSYIRGQLFNIVFNLQFVIVTSF